MRYAIIIAGGSGTRFWPLSTENEPKQFLRLYSKNTLLEETFSRIEELLKKENIYLAISLKHQQGVRRVMKRFKVPFGNVLLEPEPRNTFAPIALLSQRIRDIDPEALVAVIPSDHFVDQPKKLVAVLNRAFETAQAGYIVTLGMAPERPETGFGYVKVNPEGRNAKFYQVEKFIEKPNLKRAKSFLRDKRFYWNGGVFIFRADVLLDEIRRLQPKASKLISQIKTSQDLKRLWPRFTSTSIDYAIMEKAKKIALIPMDFKWIDLGSWHSVERIMKKDKLGNILKGNAVVLGCKNTTVWSQNKRLVAGLGLENIVIVNTKDKLLVCSKDKAQDVRKLVALLKRKKKI